MRKRISKIKKIILIVIFLIVNYLTTWGDVTKLDAADTDSPGTPQWAATVITAPNASYFWGVSVDSSDNSYAVGEINAIGVYDFGNGVTVTKTGNEENTIIVKYNSSGVVQWATKATSAPKTAIFAGVSTDSSGNSYVAGYIEGTSQYDFGNGVTVTGGGSIYNAVIVKYNSSGVAQWATTTVSAPNSAVFLGISIDSSNNSYVVGSVQGASEYDFGNGVTVSGGGDYENTIIVKYNSSGVAQWANLTPNVNRSQFEGVSVDSSGNSYAVGEIAGTSQYDFGNGVTVTGGGDSNTIIVKHNSSGVAQWAATTIAAPGYWAVFFGVSVDSSGNSYAVGEIAGTSQYDFGNGVTVTGANANENTIIVKYNSSGVAQWAATTIAAPGSAYFEGFTGDSSGNSYAVGHIRGGEYDFGNNIKVTGAIDGHNTIIVKYNSSGVAQWAATTIAAVDWSDFYGASMDSSGNIYAVGTIDGPGEYNFGNDITVTCGGSRLNTIIVNYSGDPPATPTPVSTPTSASISETTSEASAPLCNDLKPFGHPDLFQIDVTDSKATLFYTPINGSNSNYYISYSENVNTFQHGTETGQGFSTGVLSCNINFLKSNTTYYFKIRGQNGCTTGDWSNEMKIKTKSAGQNTVASYYKNSLVSHFSPLGSSVKKATEPIMKDQVSNLEPVTSTPTPTQPSLLKNKCFLWWCW
jgi:hypothetical protein